MAQQNVHSWAHEQNKIHQKNFFKNNSVFCPIIVIDKGTEDVKNAPFRIN